MTRKLGVTLWEDLRWRRAFIYDYFIVDSRPGAAVDQQGAEEQGIAMSKVAS